MNKKIATIEILNEGETIFGSPTSGEYMVRRYEDGIEMGGEFHRTLSEAGAAFEKWEGGILANPYDKILKKDA